jgi:hypothetical protein
MQWVVMAAIEWPGKASFDRNAICETEEEAKKEATRRNEVEKKAGNTETHWFPVPW